MASGAVQIEGLAELRAALGRCDAKLKVGVREALKDSANMVRVEAFRRAPVRTGRLQGSIKSFTSGNRAGVRVTAVRISRAYPSGYPYPRRIEHGVRAFLNPALEEKREDVVRRIGYVLDDIGDTWGD